jgi:hypothetical protein
MSKEPKERVRPEGRPGKAPDPDAVAARRRLLVVVRNRALSILAQRHDDEYQQIKNEILQHHGHPPIKPEYATNIARTSVEDPL